LAGLKLEGGSARQNLQGDLRKVPRRDLRTRYTNQETTTSDSAKASLQDS
jgi:hypothetical protein